MGFILKYMNPEQESPNGKFVFFHQNITVLKLLGSKKNTIQYRIEQSLTTARHDVQPGDASSRFFGRRGDRNCVRSVENHWRFRFNSNRKQSGMSGREGTFIRVGSGFAPPGRKTADHRNRTASCRCACFTRLFI